MKMKIKKFKKERLKVNLIYYLASFGSFLGGILLIYIFVLYVSAKAVCVIPGAYAAGAIWYSVDARLQIWRYRKILKISKGAKK